MIILQYPNDHLRVKTKSVEAVTPELVDTANEMYKTMRDAGGIGLAATQVGLDISLLVLEDQGDMLAMFNPVILQKSKEMEYASEGCLSFKNVVRMIKRPKEVTVKYRDTNNKMKYTVLRNMQARALIHEFEHLHGKLFIDLEAKEEKND